MMSLKALCQTAFANALLKSPMPALLTSWREYHFHPEAVLSTYVAA